VRIALDAGSPVGFRTARVLLGEPDVAHVGVLDPSAPTSGRSGRMMDLSSYDALVSDGTTDHHDLIGRCSVEGVPLVLWPDLPELATGPSHLPVIKGANVAIALTAALAVHPTAAITASDVLRVGWTEPGSPQRSGEAMPFPDPVGSVWASPRSSGRFVAFRDDDWGAAVVEAVGSGSTRIVGVGDHAEFMEAITLAAIAILAARGAYEPIIQDASSQPELLLDEVTRLELDVAAWRSSSE
jgi:hypothetical protein